jgi:outer membrane lipopolysaccharide assembly protein LptE/RlpB
MLMNRIVTAVAIAVSLVLGACGVETVGTAATSAAIKQKELDAGKQTMDQMQQKIGEAQQKAEDARQ